MHITLAPKIIGEDSRVVTVKNENRKCTLSLDGQKIMGLIKGKLQRNLTTLSVVCFLVDKHKENEQYNSNNNIISL